MSAFKHFVHVNTHWLSLPMSFGLFAVTYALMGLAMAVVEKFATKPLYVACGIFIGLFIAGEILLYVRRLHKSGRVSLPKISFKHELGRAVKYLCVMILASAFLPKIVMLLGQKFGPYQAAKPVQTNQTLLMHFMSISKVEFFAMFIMAVVIAPIVEEFLYRALLIGPKPSELKTRHVRHGHRFAMTIISAVIFIAIHVVNESVKMNYAGLITTLAGIVTYGILSVSFCLFYYRSGNYLENVCLHSAWNFITFLPMFVLL